MNYEKVLLYGMLILPIILISQPPCAQLKFVTGLVSNKLEHGKRKGKVVPVHTMKAYRGTEVQLNSLLTLALDGGEW
jgi:hypothetical protein